MDQPAQQIVRDRYPAPGPLRVKPHLTLGEDNRAKLGRKPTRYPLGDFNIRADLLPKPTLTIFLSHKTINCYFSGIP